MKNLKFLFSVLVVSAILSSAVVKAQDEEVSESGFSVGADIFSSYVWRGSKFGTGPAFQPNVAYSLGGLTLGVWGSFDALGYVEADPYISYEFPFGLTLGATDYYYPGKMAFDFSDTTGAHAIELNLGFSYEGLSLAGNYIINKAGGAGSIGGDMYFQAGYAFESFDFAVGFGNGWHTGDPDKFALCNISLGTSKEIKISDAFSLPVSGSIVFNPDKEQLYVIVGISF